MPRYCLMLENFNDQAKYAAYRQIPCVDTGTGGMFHGMTKLEVGISMCAIGLFGASGKCLVAEESNLLNELPVYLCRT